ncbi:hypothetical protein [Prosthecobacter sp.]|uniref:hypothetical protein n=1 Tax=Prosthecobacter sp. TaxID=1965333 RepID=UPI0037834886
MKTVRFSQLVAKCGRPETHLILTDPKKDGELQAAVKEQRVLTLMEATVGTKSDWGETGFHPGIHRQYLLFPKSLKAYSGRAVVGIKYEMLGDEEGAPRKRAHTHKPVAARKTTAHAKPQRGHKRPAAAEKQAIALFEPAEEEEVTEPKEEEPKKVEPKKEKPRKEKPKKEKVKEEEKPKERDTAEVAGLKRQVKRAMQDLEKGRQVAAFNILRKILEE